MTTAPEFTHNVVIRWGDPVEADAPAFDVDAQTPESQSKQFGYNNDYVGVLPPDGRRALLVTNHEYTDEDIMFPTGSHDPEVVKQVAIQSHGLSVSPSSVARRRARGSGPTIARRSTTGGSRARPSSGSTVTGKNWRTVDERFDVAKHPHEAFRFGWIVEVDPFEPDEAPVKHTMLGRFKHEGANVTISTSGHAVAYLGDDERGDYIYKFVSRDTYRDDASPASRRHNKSLLSAGTLYVARFTGVGAADGIHDGAGQWVALTSDTESFVPGMTVAQVLINTRLAADLKSPTKMDRPEDISRTRSTDPSTAP